MVGASGSRCVSSGGRAVAERTVVDGQLSIARASLELLGDDLWPTL